MSEFKFACPVCGQHITCDSTTSGTQMECPTCFRKLVIPQKPSENSSSLILTAALVGNHRPGSQASGDSSGAAPLAKAFPVAAVALVVVICAAVGGAIVFRDKLFKPSRSQAKTTNASPVQVETNIPVVTRPADDTNWTLNLADVKIPDVRATGWVDGRNFTVQRATVQGGRVTLRQAAKDPADLQVVIQLFAKQGEDLAGQTIDIETNRESPPRVTLRWKDEQQKQAKRDVREGYALRIEFGPVNGNRLPGKIYLCTPDDAKSWVAGTFDAEIRKPTPPKKPKAPPVNNPTAPKK